MKLVKLILGLAVLAVPLPPEIRAGTETEALLRVLVRKGLLTEAEVEEVRADMADDAAVVVTLARGPEGAAIGRLEPVAEEKSTYPPIVRPKGSRVDAVLIYGELQAQYYSLHSDQAVAANEHLILRRARLGVRATTARHWTAEVLYNFPSQAFHKALVGWNGESVVGPLAIYAGLSKPKVGYEENFSSSALEALERSGATRYFVESNNGRRLAAASFRVGVYLDGNPDAARGRQPGWYFGGALTNADRAYTAAQTASPVAGASHQIAPWGHFGYSAHWGDARLLIGGAAGLLPDQGGLTPTPGADLMVYSAFADFRAGRMRLAGEVLGAQMEAGRASGEDAAPLGYWLQGEFEVTDPMAVVLRYSHTDSDGRGVKVSDGLRSSPAALVGDRLDELYTGFNYRLVGRDVRFQLGYVYGRVAGADEAEHVDGVRSQIQVDF